MGVLPTEELIALRRVSRAAPTSDARFYLLARTDGADRALARFYLVAPVDPRLDQLLVFSWIRSKCRAHSTGAGAHCVRIPLDVEAISHPYGGRVRTCTTR